MKKQRWQSTFFRIKIHTSTKITVSESENVNGYKDKIESKKKKSKVCLFSVATIIHHKITAGIIKRVITHKQAKHI